MAAPLSKTDEIVLLGDDRATTEVTRLLGNMPPAIEALTGVDLSQVSRVLASHIPNVEALTGVDHRSALSSICYVIVFFQTNIFKSITEKLPV